MARYAQQGRIMFSVADADVLPSNSAADNDAKLATLAGVMAQHGASLLWFPPGVYRVTSATQAALSGLRLMGDNASFDGINLSIAQLGA